MRRERPPRRQVLRATGADLAPYASIVRVRHAPSARNTTIQADEHDEGGAAGHRDGRAVTAFADVDGAEVGDRLAEEALARAAQRADAGDQRAGHDLPGDQRDDRGRLGGRQRGEADRDHAQHAGRRAA